MISEKQKKFDELKLKLSQFLGEDACGTFDFCRFCNKDEENPCDKAETRKRENQNKPQSKKQVNINGKKKTFRATIVDK